MKSYLSYFKLRIATNLQYRAAAVAGILTQFFFGMIFIMVYIALYESNPNNTAPMDLKNVITYLWLGQAFFAVIYPYVKDQELVSMITNGYLAYELVRPHDFYFKFYIKMIAERIANASLRCLPIIIVAYLIPEPYGLPLPASIESFVLFFITLLLSCLLITSMTLMVHIIMIFTLDSTGIVIVYSMIAEVFTGMLVPLPFLPNFMIEMGKYLPFRFVGDLSYRVYSGNISVEEGCPLLLLSIAWTIIMIIIGYLLSKAALRKAVIQGG